MLTAMAETRVPRAAWLAGSIAVLPLLASLAGLFIPVEFGYREIARQAGPIYVALLITFFGGVRLGTVLGPVERNHAAQEFVLCLIPAYAAWIALALPPELTLCVLLCVLLLQALADVLAVEAGRLPYFYGKWRMLLATGAGIAILVILGERLFR